MINQEQVWPNFPYKVTVEERRLEPRAKEGESVLVFGKLMTVSKWALTCGHVMYDP